MKYYKVTYEYEGKRLVKITVDIAEKTKVKAIRYFNKIIRYYKL